MTKLYDLDGEFFITDGNHFEKLQESTMDEDIDFKEKIFAGKLVQGKIGNDEAMQLLRDMYMDYGVAQFLGDSYPRHIERMCRIILKR